MDDLGRYRVSIEILAYCENDAEAEKVGERLQAVCAEDESVAEFECWVGKDHARPSA